MAGDVIRPTYFGKFNYRDWETPKEIGRAHV